MSIVAFVVNCLLFVFLPVMRCLLLIVPCVLLLAGCCVAPVLCYAVLLVRCW